MKISPEQKIELALLVTRIKKGDDRAFERFIELTQDSVFRFCFFLSKNREQADEFCQETFLKAIESLKTIQSDDAVLDWLLKISKNLFLDSYRGSKRRSEILAESESPETVAIQPLESVLAVREVLSQFDPDDRALLILIDLENYTYAEAAVIIGVSEDAVRSRIHRLRQEFSKNIGILETN